LQNQPGGVYGGSPVRPTYGAQEPYYPQETNPGILTGPTPSWVREGPIKNFDKCKCSEKFNCNSPGISYGHCDVGKQYCCYSTKKEFGGPVPSKPVHSIENGILVGPGGPIDPIPGTINYPRPPKLPPNQLYRPGGFHNGAVGFDGFNNHASGLGAFNHQAGGLGGFNNQAGGLGGFNHQAGGLGGFNNQAGGLGGFREENVYSSDNGILVGPGGPTSVHSHGFQQRSSIKASNAK